MYSTSVEDDKVVEEEKKAETATTTPEETAVANLAVHESPPKDNSISEEEADFTIAEVDPNDI